MFTFKSLSIKNFMSFGNVSHHLELDTPQLTLVLGENLDVPAEAGGSRNGVGKSSILNAICFALYGEPISNIKMDNLINLTNEKNLEVSLTFEHTGVNYRIERGRKPNYFRFFVDDKLYDEEGGESKNIAQGESRETQKDVQKIIGISCELFKQIVGLNTLSLPFLSQPAKNQRELIEELLRIAELSEKAEKLKENLKQTKEFIAVEELKIKSIKDSNEKVQKTIEDLKKRSFLWETKHTNAISVLETDIESLLNLNIDEEIDDHKKYSTYTLYNAQSIKLKNDKNYKAKQHLDIITRKNQYETNLDDVENNSCPTCHQHVHSETQDEIKSSVEQKIKSINDQEGVLTQEIKDLETAFNTLIKQISDLGEIKKPFYKTVEEAYSHRSKLESMAGQLQSLLDDHNPYDTQMITQQEDLLQTIDVEYLQTLNVLREHQEFLYKLLTNKDSAVRKKIIEQNLNYLNYRLGYYIEKLGLPHNVLFMNDLSVNITEHGRELDFGNLSKGEGTRLILGLSFAFRDVYESVETPINLVYIDEILDSGIDGAGLENAIKLLKQMVRDQNRNIFLVSHREELIPRVENILTVRKENGFSSIQHCE